MLFGVIVDKSMINYGRLLSTGIIVFAVSLFSSSIFSGLSVLPSQSFPLNSALASTTGGTDTEDETQSPRLAPEGTLPDEPEVVEPPPPPPPPPDDDITPDVEPPTVADPTPDDGQPTPPPGGETPDVEPPTVADPTPDDGQPTPPPTEPPITNETTPTEPPATNGTTTGGNQTTLPNNATFTQNITELRLQDRILVQIQPSSACTTTGSDSEHWNKIVFRIASDPTARIDSSLINTELEVLERVHDGGVLNLKDIVRYSIVTEPGILPQFTFEDVEQLEIEILDVEYTLICSR